MKPIFDKVLNYLTQASTYKGIFTIAGAAGLTASEGLTQALIALFVAIFGLVDVVVDERKDK